MNIEGYQMPLTNQRNNKLEFTPTLHNKRRISLDKSVNGFQKIDENTGIYVVLAVLTRPKVKKGIHTNQTARTSN